MRVVALLAPLFCACAFQPILSGTGDHAAQIVRPESGCLQVFGGLLLFDRLQNSTYVQYENLMTTYNKQAEATGCPPLAPTPEPGRE